MEKIKMIVTGRVQGVAFRFTTKMVADQIGIHGYVKNLSDGSVYIEATGSEEKMTLFIEKVKASPSPSGRVDHLTITEDPTIEETKKFTVKY